MELLSWLTSANYLWLKALHIIFFTSWFAGLFYLPRIFVNIAMVEDDNTYQHLLTMAGKLYRFVTPIMYITAAFGIWLLYINTALLSQGWMHLKLALVSILIAYHFVCGYYLKQFQQNNVSKSHVYFRWFNELPVVVLFVVVFAAITKSF